MLLLKLHSHQGMFLISRREYLIRKISLIRSLGIYLDVNRYSTRTPSYILGLEQCKSTKSIEKLHSQIIIGGHEQNPFIASKLIVKYVDSSVTNIEVARKVFDGLTHRDVLLWNVVIRCYANSGPFVGALEIYRRMRVSATSANHYTYPFLLKACSAMGDLKNGRVVHGHTVKSGLDLDLFTGNALIALYSKSGDILSSTGVFNEMPRKDIISWNSMISGNVANGHPREALTLFRAVVRGQTTCCVDQTTLVSTLPACVQTLAIQAGFWIHSYIVKTGMEVDHNLGSGLVSMYAHFGRVSIARQVFDRCRDKSLQVWSSMIRCYGTNGLADEALQVYSKMLDFGLRPDGVTFLCLLSACSHAGLVKEGCEIFKKMEDFGVEKQDKHYACMVDLLARAGLADRAIEFAEGMTVQPGKDVYGALLSACRAKGDLELAKEIAENLAAVDPCSYRQYITLANIYEEKGRWEDATRIREELREKTPTHKLIGVSSIQVYH